MPGKPFPILRPDLQVSFLYRLDEIRGLFLEEAMAAAVASLPVTVLDKELGEFVAEPALRKVASFGLRGERIFPVPSLLTAKPTLLGYYRLLYGISQKEFFSKGPFGRFKRLEEGGKVSPALATELSDLCRSLAGTGEILVAGVSTLSAPRIHELQVLTLGGQLRGSRNNSLGQDATQEVFHLIEGLVKGHVREATDKEIVLVNSAGRRVRIRFAPDPDIEIVEEMETEVNPVVSIEIKGGTDRSNIHNRIGEAEKSHQKAKARGFTKFWTIIRVDIGHGQLKKESPTTNRFFHMDGIQDTQSQEFKEFRDQLISAVGIPNRKARRP